MNHFIDELLRLNPNATDEQKAEAAARDVEAGEVAKKVEDRCKVYYTNLVDIWPTLTGDTSDKLKQINTMTADDGVTPWWQANGYTSPFTTDDLVAAGGLQ